ncbi:MAG: cytochrome c1 [Rickettsiaceae bacterium]|nr:cytochrome c1 [Rickettsiaceae bacterium]
MLFRVTISFVIFFSSSVFAHSDIELKSVNWPFEGIFGTFDRKSAQRGFQVYKEVCSACHSMNHIYYRNLLNLGFSEEEIKELAKSITVKDGPNEQGEYFERPGVISDRFPNPYPNENAARSANGGAVPVDLSLIVKARPNGANYIYSLLTGYADAPNGFEMMPGLVYNTYFPGHQIAMPQPLSDGMVQYMDGTGSTVEQMSRDIVIFLQWAAEPEMEHRKEMGLKSLIFLFIFTIVFYRAKKRIWAKLK